MGTVMDIYQLVRDLIDEAKNQKNLELVDRLIEIKLALSEIEDVGSSITRILELYEIAFTISTICCCAIVNSLIN